MDRREALKRLAGGGAVALGASSVLASNGVAFAASLGDTGLVGFPPPGVELPSDEVVTGGGNSNKTVTVTIDTAGVSCSQAGPPTILYGWRLIDSSSGNIALVLPSGIRLESVSSSYTALNPLDNSVLVRRSRGNGSLNGQNYRFGLLTEAFCGAGLPYVRTEFEFVGTGGSITQIPGTQTIIS